ncbi:MAG: hypothetical protein IB616_03075 [Methanosarcinales archaeon]|nr:MAG: hypothetical protein IB616_03075 [Methanosarcinales archaeon]
MTKLQQRIHLNRRGVNSIEFDTQELVVPLEPGEETSFDINVINYGTPTHIHLAAVGDIRDNVTFLSHNPYVRYEETIPVVVRIPREDKKLYAGEIEVTAGYGAKKSIFTVKLGTEVKEVPAVEVQVETKRPWARSIPVEVPIEHPLTLPVALVIAALALAIMFGMQGPLRIAGAVAFSILIVFAMVYSISKLIKM